MHKPAIIAGVAAFFIAVIAYVAFAFKGKQPPLGTDVSITGGTGSGTSGNVTPDDPTSSTPQSAFDFGWVDGNDKKGAQRIDLGLTHIQDGKHLLTAGEYSNLFYEAGKTYEFQVWGGLFDMATNKPLAGWGYALHVFDTEFRSVGDKAFRGVTASNGGIAAKVKITPSKPGVYRIRVAAGDAANEEAIEFKLLAIGLEQAIGR